MIFSLMVFSDNSQDIESMAQPPSSSYTSCSTLSALRDGHSYKD